MTEEDKVKISVPRARCVAIPKKGEICSNTSHFEILVGLNAHPKRIGIGFTREQAWADAARKLETPFESKESARCTTF